MVLTMHSYHPRLHPMPIEIWEADDLDDNVVDLHAALMADPDNVEAKAMLHARSQTIDKLLTSSTSSTTPAPGPTASPHPPSGFHANPYSRQLERVSIEIWREVALFLPRRDLKTLLFVPHILSRVSSQLLFRELDLHFTGGEYGFYGGGGDSDDETGGAHGGVRDRDMGVDERERDEGRHAQRTADILTRLIVDQKFANAVRMLKIYCSARRDRDGSMAFQTGMLMNVLPKLTNLKNMYLSAPSESIVPVLRILQTTGTKLHGLSLHSPDSPADLSFLELRNLSHFSYTTSGGTLSCITPLLGLSRHSLSSLALENTHTSPSPHWAFPLSYVSVRNLTSLNFTGHFSKEHGAGIMGEILRDGRQIENLSIVCCALDSGGLSREFKNASAGWSSSGSMHGTSTPTGSGGPFGGSAQHVTLNSNGTPIALPFLRHFAFTISAIGRRTSDRDLFCSIADFLRGRKSLRSLKLIVSCDEHVQSAVGFSAAVWGVLPSLEGLRGLAITYPGDLTAGLASWLVPRSVRALTLSLDYGNATTRDPVPFLSSLKQGMPPNLKFIGLSELNVRHASLIVEQGFPTVRVVRVGQSYWTVHHRKYGGGSGYSSLGSSPSLGTASTRQLLPSMSSHFGGSTAGLSGPGHSTASSSNTPHGRLSPIRDPSDRTGDRDQRPPLSNHPSSLSAAGGTGASSQPRLVQLRPLTHTGHPHSGHTHGHPGSSNPHPPHAHLLNPVPSSSAHGGDSARGGTSDSRGGYGGLVGSGGSGHHHQSMGPPASSSSGLMSSGILLGPGGADSAGAAVLDLEPWPRRRVLYHVAEWLEWLGCEDALVRDQSAFPAWTMTL
ncbi:hypothetical protein DFP72DRAFT_578781 [Ephemerocybe angulata]|uniref:Uncharacterized protein n=1 Tax=Ephemerocybe angulata TaxID=980116 RepID=A0A8H6HJK1_9AGAR|nr:hypothetical protein DFP72DRAFT_578781 [Tulosesus angulatus]